MYCRDATLARLQIVQSQLREEKFCAVFLRKLLFFRSVKVEGFLVKLAVILLTDRNKEKYLKE